MNRQLNTSEVQDITFNALCYLDEICRKNRIPYYLAYGTLLGAVRGNDFIPWDDDVDVWMKRSDYVRFASAIKDDDNALYFYQSLETDPFMPAPAEARICINGTLNNPHNLKKQKFHQGVWIDIFPLDISQMDRNKLSQKTKRLRTIQRLIVNKHRTYEDYPNWIGRIKHCILSLIPYHLIVKQEKRLIERASTPDPERLIDYAASWAIGDNPLRFVFYTKWFNDTIYIDFHGRVFPCPIGYKDILNQRYGPDYMTPIHDGRDPYPKFAIEL